MSEARSPNRLSIAVFQALAVGVLVANILLWIAFSVAFVASEGDLFFIWMPAGLSILSVLLICSWYSHLEVK